MGKFETHNGMSIPPLEQSPPVTGPPLPKSSPLDPAIVVDIAAPTTSIGTAFAIDNKGTWLTARHVVDSCDQVGLKTGNGKYVKVAVKQVSSKSDTALLVSKWNRPALARDFFTRRQIGERGFFLGYPQGNPGEATGTLLGRRRMVVQGRYRSTEAILAWAETGRTRGLKGSLGGISGGPAFDSDGEVIGLIAAESIRRGRIYTVAPATLADIMPTLAEPANGDPIGLSNYSRRANAYRKSRRIAQVVCLIE